MKLSRKHIFYVYALLDPRKLGPFRYGRWVFSHEPFYIGKGKEDRAKFHFYCCAKSQRTHRSRKMRKISQDGLDAIVVYKKMRMTERQALDTEISLIRRIGRFDLKRGPLTNHTDGGEKPSGYVYTPYIKRKISKSKIGHSVSEETRKKISIAHKGKKKPHSPEHCARLSEVMKGRVVNWGHKISASKRGKKQTPAHIAAASAGHRGLKYNRNGQYSTKVAV